MSKASKAGAPAKMKDISSQTNTATKKALSARKPAAKTTEWWEKGVRFECQGSGKCCVSHGQFGFVYMTLADRKRMAKVVGLSTAEFTRKYCIKSDGVYHLKDGDNQACIFLKGKGCSVYEGRPDQCRTWPWWPEVMNAKAWAKDVAAFCPGIGKGRKWSGEEIRKNLELQKKSEIDLVYGR